MKTNKIEFEFIEHKFDYSLPLIGIDLDFLVDRRVDIVLCIERLAKRIANINLASRYGITEMSMATKLLSWYHNALREINSKTYMLNNPGAFDKKAMTDTEAALWIAASSRRD